MITYKHLLRMRTSDPQMGDKIWVEYRIKDDRQSNGYCSHIYWRERAAEFTFHYQNERWHKKDKNTEVFSFEELAFCWTDKFEGTYMILNDDSAIVELERWKKERADDLKDLHQNPLYILLKSSGDYNPDN